jgi:hypothetical protein
MKVGDLVQVNRIYHPVNLSCKEWNVTYSPTRGIVKRLTDRLVDLELISNQTGKPLYRETFFLNEIKCVLESR